MSVVSCLIYLVAIATVEMGWKSIAFAPSHSALHKKYNAPRHLSDGKRLFVSRMQDDSIAAHDPTQIAIDCVVNCAKKVVFVTLTSLALTVPAFADGGASDAANAKITKGGASTLQSGRTISITRGVNLDRTDFSGQNLKGVAFQQSIVRDANFKGSKLVGASFFDATLDGSNFENADLTMANFEMAQLDRVSLKNAVVRDMFVSGSTILEGIKDIENSDWTDTFLRKDQQKYLCNHPTAKGVNPTTGVDTRESLMCVN